MINYTTDLSILDELELDGFFVDWGTRPSNEILKKVLRGSYKVVLALKDKKLVGFVNSISDGILFSYIPMVEVIVGFQNQGIGKELIKIITEELSHLYTIDLLCDEDLFKFYEKFGMMKAHGASLKNFSRQSGEN